MRTHPMCEFRSGSCMEPLPRVQPPSPAVGVEGSRHTCPCAAGGRDGTAKAIAGGGA